MYWAGKHLSHSKPSSRCCSIGLGFSETRGAERCGGQCGPHTPDSPSFHHQRGPHLQHRRPASHSCRVCVSGGGWPQARRATGAAAAWPPQGRMRFPCCFCMSFFGLCLAGHTVSHGHLHTPGRLRGQQLLFTVLWGRRPRGRALGMVVRLAKPSDG